MADESENGTDISESENVAKVEGEEERDATQEVEAVGDSGGSEPAMLLQSEGGDQAVSGGSGDELPTITEGNQQDQQDQQDQQAQQETKSEQTPAAQAGVPRIVESNIDAIKLGINTYIKHIKTRFITICGIIKKMKTQAKDFKGRLQINTDNKNAKINELNEFIKSIFTELNKIEDCANNGEKELLKNTMLDDTQKTIQKAQGAAGVKGGSSKRKSKNRKNINTRSKKRKNTRHIRKKKNKKIKTNNK